MIAILIFAGRSTRFWPLSEKSFFPICDTTLLEEQVRRLKAAGFNEILLVGGKHNLKEAKAKFPTLPIAEQKDLDLGMRGALLSALPKCGDKPVMVVSANDLIDIEAYAELRARAKAMKEGGLILSYQVKQYFPGGYLSLKGKRITGIVEKPGEGNEPSKFVNIVAHVHLSAAVLLKALKTVKSTKDDGYEVALDSLFKELPYEAVKYTGAWQAVKFPWHLLSILLVLLPKDSKPLIHPSATIHPTAVVSGAVVIGPNVKVFAHASVVGPCTIGEGTVIANNALVRDSSIGKNCVIGYNTEVVRSILADDVWTHMSYVGDSILGSNVSLGGGTITGNLRLDEEEILSVIREKATATGRNKFGAVIGSDVRTGIHTGIAPGVKIGAGSFINSMTMVTKDIPEGSFVKMKGHELDIRPNAKRSTSPSGRGKFKKLLG